MKVTAPPKRVRKSTNTRPRRRTKQPAAEPGGLAVLQNRPFLLLWLAQLSTQVGGNTVIYGLTILIREMTHSNTAISALFLSFLVPAIVFSAIAGVFVDRVDKRHMLVVTNVLRGLAFLAIVLVGDNLLLLYTLMVLVATITTFFGPAEASMIPYLVPRPQLVAANGFFTLTSNVAFALGFALVGPFLIALASPQALVAIVAAMYFVAAAFCWTLPSDPPPEEGAETAGQAVADAERAVETMLGELGEGMAYIRDHRGVRWTLSFLGITGALIGILGVLGVGFAETTLALGEKDFVVVVLPLGLGIVTGIVGLNYFGRLAPRRRAIEVGMISLGILVALLSFAGPISHFLENNVGTQFREASRVVSVLSLVIVIAYLIGCSYAVVAISAQTQLQEDLPEEVRGRVFGVLNMLVSISSLAPILVVGFIADIVQPEGVILVAGIVTALAGVASVVNRGSLRPAEVEARAGSPMSGAAADPITIALSSSELTAGAAAATEDDANPAVRHRSRRGLEDGESSR